MFSAHLCARVRCAVCVGRDYRHRGILRTVRCDHEIIAPVSLVPASPRGVRSGLLIEDTNMRIELSRDEAEVLRNFLEQKILELDKEINRTDSLRFKEELRQVDRTIGRVLAQLTSALSGEQSGTGR